MTRSITLVAAAILVGCGEEGYEGAVPYQPELMTPLVELERLATCPPTRWAAAEPELVADGLDVPWDLLFMPDGRLLVSERSGQIRLITFDAEGVGHLAAQPWAVVPAVVEEEHGLMGLAYRGTSDSTGFVYAVTTVPGDWDLASGSNLPGVGPDEFTGARRNARLRNQIIRFEDKGQRGVSPEVIVDGIPADIIHAGGGLSFGPDGKLYSGIGEAMGWGGPNNNGLGPRWSSSIHRYNPDGTVPDDNPDPTSAVFATGFRNPQAFGWHPETGQLFATDHGPSNLSWEHGLSGRDELNLVVAGADYGWPSVSGAGEGGGFAWPVQQFDGLVPAGLSFFTDSSGSSTLFLGGLGGVRLVRVQLTWGDGNSGEFTGPVTAQCQEELFVGQFGRIRALAQGPDGYLYFSTTNGDGRGVADPEGDRVFRVRPPS